MYKNTKKAIIKQADSVVPDKWKEISEAVSETATVYQLPERKKYYAVKPIIGAVACFCVVLGAILFYQNYNKPSVPLDTNNPAALESTNTQADVIKKRTVITEDKSGARSSCCYKAPDPGEIIYSIQLRNALEEHKEEDVYYLLYVSMHKKDGRESRLVTEEEKKAEYQRLASLGYEFYKTEAWYYEGEEAKKVYYPIVLGCFTEKELYDFDINPEYGYLFDFVRNGDGSPIPFDECEKIVVKEGKWGIIE